MGDLRYLDNKDKFLEYAYLALNNHFPNYNRLLEYFESIQGDEKKNLFLKIVSYYLFLVKNGDWMVEGIPYSDNKIDYLTNTYKFITLFSLIESLTDNKYVDFYNYLIQRKSKISFPIGKEDLKKYYECYNDKYGSIRRCITFFKSLNEEKQTELISKLKLGETKGSIEAFAKYLYNLRSKFVHEAYLLVELSELPFIRYRGNKKITCELSINDTMMFFEEGLITYFGKTI